MTEDSVPTSMSRPNHGTTAPVPHKFSGADWLDLHFEACQPEYEAVLRSSGIKRGWRVLDAGCGSGSFLPAIAELVGRSGAIIALDLDPENVAVTSHRVAEEWRLACPVEVLRGSVLEVPLPDDHVDAVWCANVQEYLPDDDLLAMLREFRRIVRPGGLVIIKDADLAHFVLRPADEAFLWHHFEAALAKPYWNAGKGAFRAWNLRRHFEQAGLTYLWQRSSLIERRGPLRPIERAYLGEYLGTHAGIALDVHFDDLPAPDLELWQHLADAEAGGSLLDHPDFYWCEGQVIAVGQVPYE